MRSATLQIRVDPEEHGILNRAAEMSHQTLSEFVRQASIQNAENVLADRVRFVVDDARWEAYERALDAPAEVKPELVELFRSPDVFA